ncbi:ABC transporter permease [Aneurinibacillus migulanus]|uniref:ABC transporter permease n=1 Tax=Aneurinibacillus migulanus TaxID=47500 RepID=UPI002E2174EE|nr:ABC transporter permease [Aneurinibacillus migulanus]
MNDKTNEDFSLFKAINPFFLLRIFFRHRELIVQFTKREILSRYRGSFLGVLWSFINPLIMLVVYTFVFSVVFKAKWGQLATTTQTEFALILFSGIITFNIFSEMINRAPNLVTGNVNYVKKVIFPLEILPVTVLLSTLVHAFISLLVLIIFACFIMDYQFWTLIFIPILLFPLIVFSLGLSWFFASVGVYVRDLSYTIGLATNVLFFITPIFYPISAVPEFFREFMYINPLTTIVENFRKVVIWGQMPDWNGFILVTIISYIVMVLGFSWFVKTRKGFADVL